MDIQTFLKKDKEIQKARKRDEASHVARGVFLGYPDRGVLYKGQNGVDLSFSPFFVC